MNATYATASMQNAAPRGYVPEQGIRRSYAPTVKRFAAPSGQGHRIKYGDRLMVRLTSGFRTIAEFEIDTVNDFSELLGELRHYTRGKRGLAQLTIRNATRGWSIERPLMLYADRFPSRREPASAAPEPKRAPSRPYIPESIYQRYGYH